MTIETKWTNNPDGSATIDTVIDIEIETDFTGQKMSEGDGRTSADIEEEQARGAQ